MARVMISRKDVNTVKECFEEYLKAYPGEPKFKRHKMIDNAYHLCGDLAPHLTRADVARIWDQVYDPEMIYD